MVFKTSRYNSFFESRFFHECVGKTSVERFVGSLDQRCEDGALIKTGKKTSITSCDMGTCALVIKRYNYRGAFHALRQTVFGSRARRAWKNARILQKVHIPTPQALACIEVKRHGLVAWSYIITERFAGDNLHFHLIKQRPDQAGCQTIIAALQRLIDQMGEQRITHRDLKHSNIMMNDEGQAALIDLDSMQVHRFDLVYKIKRAKDLKAFAKRIVNEKLTAPLETKHDESLS
jgi:tRNA A-37 threonylcarbamoyl transferase component Bud32